MWALLKYHNPALFHKHNYRPPFQKLQELVVCIKSFHFPKLLTLCTNDKLAHAQWHRKRSNCKGHICEDIAAFKYWRPKVPETWADRLKLSLLMFVHCFYMENYIFLKVYV